MLVAFNLIRVLVVSSLVAIVLSICGCSQGKNIVGGDDPEHAPEVTLTQLKDFTKSEGHFVWFGCDDKFHYFELQKKFYRMPIKFDIPAVKDLMARKAELGKACRDVRIEGDAIVKWKNKPQAK